MNLKEESHPLEVSLKSTSGHGHNSHIFLQPKCEHTYVEDQIHTFHITASISNELQAQLHGFYWLHRQSRFFCACNVKEFPATVREWYPKKCRKSINKLLRL
jgi:hypothetical protein